VRARRSHELKILGSEGRSGLFRGEGDAGTYIRTLCVDIGDALGVGASMEDLRRTRSGNMTEDKAVTLQDIKDAYVGWQEGDERWLRSMLLPIEVLFDPLPKVVIKDSAVDAVCHGANLAAVGVAKVDASIRKDAMVAMFTAKGEAVAVGTASMDADGIVKVKEGVAITTDRVYMPAGTYPKMW